MARRGGGGAEDYQLTQAQIEALRAQTEATRADIQQQAARTTVAQQEQATRAAAQQQAAAESQFKIGQEREMTPFQKLLQLSQAGAPEVQERINKIRAAVDLYQAGQTAKTAQAQMQTQRDIEAGREKGALERQQEASRSNVTDAMITHLATRPDIVDPAVFREALKRRGAPELAAAYDAVREPIIASQVEANKAGLTAAHKTGKLDAAFQGVTDPDVRARLQPFVDKLKNTVPPATQEEMYPGYGGGAAADIRYAPIDFVNLLSTVANKTAVPFSNILNSIVGAPPMAKAPILPRDYQAAWEVLNQ